VSTAPVFNSIMSHADSVEIIGWIDVVENIYFTSCIGG